jgi:hypothetical protein
MRSSRLPTNQATVPAERLAPSVARNTVLLSGAQAGHSAMGLRREGAKPFAGARRAGQEPEPALVGNERG